VKRQVERDNLLRERNIFGQFIVFFLTLGLYAIYWFYSTLDEMTRYQNVRTESVLWTVLTLIPIIHLFGWWKHASTFDKLTDGRYPSLLMWILGVFITPVYWIVVQIELNAMARVQNQQTS